MRVWFIRCVTIQSQVAIVIVACHLCALTWLGFVQTPVWHEPAQLAAGLSWWRFGRSDVICVNPPFIRLLVATPVAVFQPVMSPNEFDRPPSGRDEFNRAGCFIKDNLTHARQYFAIARGVCILFSVAGALACWYLARSLFGSWSGLMAVVLWCFSPIIIGNGSTIMPDVPSAAMGLAAVYFFWRWLGRPKWLEALVAGLVLGLAELCKFTLLIFYPLLPLLWIIYRLPERYTMNRQEFMRQAAMLFVTLFVSVYVINCGYLFEETFTPLEEFHFRSKMFTGYDSFKDIPPEGANRFAGTWLGNLLVPLPANMLQGIDIQRYDFERGLPSYLRGEWANHGWWYYYLYALMVKVPLGTWSLVVLAVGMMIFDWRKKMPSSPVPLPNGERSCLPLSPPAAFPQTDEERYLSASWRDEMIVFVPGLTILIFVSSQTGFSVHSRYIIPALPFLFVWTSKVARIFEMRPFNKRRLVMSVAVVAALTWSVCSSLAIYPHSLSYFNELTAVLPTPADALYPKPIEKEEHHGIWTSIRTAITAGPRSGPRHLLNSNIDWGQDLLFLKDWLNEHPEVKLDGLAYYGSYSTTLVGIPETPMPATGREYERFDPNQPQNQLGPKPGWYALSVNYLYDHSHQYRYFLNFHPVATAGYSIYIYHITLDEANRVRRELGLPEFKSGRKAKNAVIDAEQHKVQL